MKKRRDRGESSYINELKILLLGDSVVKTALANKYYYNFFNISEKLTIGVDFYAKTIELDHRKFKLQLWDICGEERIRFLVPTFIRGAKGAIFMYDIGNYNSLAHIDDWLVLIRKELRSEDLFPIVLAGVSLGLKEDYIISSEEGLKVAKQYNLHGFIECSAKTGENIEEMFEKLARLIIHKNKNQISEIEEIKKPVAVLQKGDQKYCPNCRKPLTQKIALDSTKCLLFFDPNNRKAWLWRGNKVDIREKLNAVKAARFKKSHLGSEIELQTVDEGKEPPEFKEFFDQSKAELRKYRKLIRLK